MEYKVEISQNGWEYVGFAFIDAKNLTKHEGDGENDFLIADGVKIRFDEEIGEVTDEDGNPVSYNSAQ